MLTGTVFVKTLKSFQTSELVISLVGIEEIDKLIDGEEGHHVELEREYKLKSHFQDIGIVLPERKPKSLKELSRKEVFKHEVSLMKQKG